MELPLSYVTDEAVRFSVPLHQLDIRWRPGHWWRIPGCDVHVGSTLYRLYLESPHDTAPEYDERAAQQIGEKMSALGALQHLSGVVGDAFLFVRLLASWSPSPPLSPPIGTR
jgi:hypothetical protein